MGVSISIGIVFGPTLVNGRNLIDSRFVMFSPPWNG